MVSLQRLFGLGKLPEERTSMNATDTMRIRRKAKILEIPDAPVHNRQLRCVYFACDKFLEQRGIGSNFTRSYRVRPGKTDWS
jgi:hypothetical protein